MQLKSLIIYQQNEHCTTYQDLVPAWSEFHNVLELCRNSGEDVVPWALQVNGVVMAQSVEFCGDTATTISHDEFWCSWCFGYGVYEDTVFDYLGGAMTSNRVCENCDGLGYHESALDRSEVE